MAATRTANKVLEKRTNGYLVGYADGRCHWRRSLARALRAADKARDVWGERIMIHDCETKEIVYRFRFLGN